MDFGTQYFPLAIRARAVLAVHHGNRGSLLNVPCLSATGGGRDLLQLAGQAAPGDFVAAQHLPRHHLTLQHLRRTTGPAHLRLKPFMQYALISEAA